MQGEYCPPSDPSYDFSTTCSKQDAVKYLLGWPMGPLQSDIIADDDASPGELEQCDYSLETILIESREAAEAEYSNAIFEALGGDVITEKLSALRKCDLDIERAHQYLCRIDNELTKGDDSVLRIDPNATINPKEPQITLISLSEWATDKFGIQLFNAPQANNKDDPSVHQPNENVKDGLSKTKAANLQITLALLVEAFARTAPKFTISDRPNVKTIAEELVKRAKEHNCILPGQSQSAIEKAVKAAMEVKKNPPI